MRELRGVQGVKVMPVESPLGASAANVVIERCVWDMQSTTRSLVAYAEWVHNTMYEPGSVILAWVAEFSGQGVSRFQRSFSDGKTAYERWKQKSYRKEHLPVGELVMYMPMEKPKDKGEIRNRVGIMLGLEDRSDEVVVGTIERVVKVRTVHRRPAGQRGDATSAKCNRGRTVATKLALLVFRWLQSRTDWQFQSWSRGITKPVGSTSGTTWSSRSTDSPMTVRDSVWRSGALRRSLTAVDAVSASGMLR